MAHIARQATMLKNEPAIFAARFWRNFYVGLLTKAARSAMTKRLLFVLTAVLFPPALGQVDAGDRLNLVIALDFSRSVVVAGADGKNEFRKNVDGVARILGDILLRARVPDVDCA